MVLKVCMSVSWLSVAVMHIFNQHCSPSAVEILSAVKSLAAQQSQIREKREAPNPNVHSLGWIQCYLTQLCLQKTFRAHTHTHAPTRLQTHKMEGGMSSTQISLQRLFVLFDVFIFSTCLEVKLFSLSECSTVSPKISFQAENESLSDYSKAEN